MPTRPSPSRTSIFRAEATTTDPAESVGTFHNESRGEPWRQTNALAANRRTIADESKALPVRTRWEQIMQNILVGYDGSPSARHAVTFALDLAKRFDARLHVLVVARAPDWGAIELERKEMIDYELRHANEVLDEIKAKLVSSGEQAEFDLVVGQPAKEIVLYTEQHGIDHLVVGHRGHTPFDRWLIGSVARQVLAYAPCAVTIVRDPASVKKRRAKSEQRSTEDASFF
jgi:nucleotide-binding universal stress UspA family protein